MLTVLGVNFAVCLLAFGSRGWRAPVQMIASVTAWDLTVGSAILLYVGLSILIAVLTAVVTMMLSMILGSSTTVLAVQFGVFFVFLFSIPDHMGTLSKLWSLRPTQFLNYSTFTDYRLFHVGDRFLNMFQSAEILYACLAAAVLPLILSLYRKAQVRSR